MGAGWLNFRPELGRVKQAGLFRERLALTSAQAPRIRVQSTELTNFCSNDYLSLANDPRLVSSLQRSAAEYGIGSGASPLVCGRSLAHEELEKSLAELTGRDKALLFSSGYLANLAIVSTFAQSRHTSIFEDKLNHASMLDGALLSRGKLQRYPHADSAALERLLQESTQKKKLVLTDSVFSMDGDMAPLRAIASLASKYEALLAVDDAHGFGVYGAGGAGSLTELGLDQESVPLMMATLGKAAGCSGAFVAGRADLVEFLVQKARPYIYSTAMPSALAATALESLKLLADEGPRRRLQELIAYFREQAGLKGVPLLASSSPIQPLMIGDPQQAVDLSQGLREQGFLVMAIRPPTVPQGTSRLRITLCAGHSKKDIDALLNSLSELLSARDKRRQ